MQAFFGIVYIVFILGCITASCFILFHLLRYSLDRRLAVIMSIIFSSVVIVLLITNAALFFTLPFDAISSNTALNISPL